MHIPEPVLSCACYKASRLEKESAQVCSCLELHKVDDSCSMPWMLEGLRAGGGGSNVGISILGDAKKQKHGA